MDSVPKQTFESMYAGQAPWEIGKPQPAILAVADQITGSVLDAGCGTGDLALYFASRGCRVIGIDFLDEAITKATRKAEARNLPVTFLAKDALELKGWSERFDNVVDCGLFHGLSDQDQQRYVTGLATVLQPGGRVFLLCFSDEEPGTHGPRRVSKQELHNSFAHGWVVDSIQPSFVEGFDGGRAKAWLAMIRRAGHAAGSGGP